MDRKGFTVVEILIVVVLLVIIGGGICVYMTQNSSPTLTPTSQPTMIPHASPTVVSEVSPTSDPYMDWEKYTNVEFGFSVKYPTDWVLGEYDKDTAESPGTINLASSKNQLTRLTNGGGLLTIMIFDKEDNPDLYDSWLENYTNILDALKQGKTTLVINVKQSINSVVVDGLTGTVYSNNGIPSGTEPLYNVFTIFKIDGLNRLIILRLQNSTSEDRDTYRPTYEQIVESFNIE